MPLYEYERADGTRFDVIQAISERALARCPDTGQPVRRVLSAPAVVFRGSGFHNTDNPARSRRHGQGRPAAAG